MIYAEPWLRELHHKIAGRQEAQGALPKEQSEPARPHKHDG